MRGALKLQVTISTDRLVQLPGEVPEGRAEIIVLFPDAAVPDERTRKGTVRKRTRSASKRASAKADRAGYFARLVARQPSPLSARASRALDEADRGER